MASLRRWGGIAGFPRRVESEYDTFGTAHSSTSISAALGMAIAAKRKGEQRAVVAVIGDGAMSAGMAFEALNNAGTADANLLVILNDNDMSISEPVGALNNYLARLPPGRVTTRCAAAGRRCSRSCSGEGARQALGRAHQGHVSPELRGVWLQLHRADRQARPRDAGATPNGSARRATNWLYRATARLPHGRGGSDPITASPSSICGASMPKPPSKPSYTQVFGDWL